MTIYYLDPSAATNGTGSQANPLNTTIGLALSFNDSLLIKTGTVMREVIQNCLNNIGITVGSYGTGDAPKLVGNIQLDTSKCVYVPAYDCYAAAFQFNGTVQSPVAVVDGVIKLTSSTTQAVPAASVAYLPRESRTTSFSNQLGNITQDGEPLVFVPWAGNLADTVNNAPSTSHTSSGKKLDAEGRFSYDYTNNVMYFKPVGGSLNGVEFSVSVLPFGLVTAWPHATLARKLTVRDIDVYGQSRHGISAQYRKEVVIDNVLAEMIGGAWDGSSVYYGNGIELTYGCDDSSVSNLTGIDIFDTVATAQLYDVVGSSIRRQDWTNIKAVGCGLSAFELSLQNGKSTGNTYFGCGVIEHVNVYNLELDNSQDMWATGRGGSGYLMINNSGAGSRIHNNKLFGFKAKSNNKGAVINSARTAGTNGFTDVAASGFVYGVSSAIASMPQTDVLSRCDFGGATNNFPSGDTTLTASQILE